MNDKEEILKLKNGEYYTVKNCVIWRVYNILLLFYVISEKTTFYDVVPETKIFKGLFDIDDVDKMIVEYESWN